jgi:hypothetical protein
MVTRSEELVVNGEGRRETREGRGGVVAAQDILRSEMIVIVMSSLRSIFQIFVDLSAADTASIPS